MVTGPGMASNTATVMRKGVTVDTGGTGKPPFNQDVDVIGSGITEWKHLNAAFSRSWSQGILTCVEQQQTDRLCKRTGMVEVRNLVYSPRPCWWLIRSRRIRRPQRRGRLATYVYQRLNIRLSRSVHSSPCQALKTSVRLSRIVFQSSRYMICRLTRPSAGCMNAPGTVPTTVKPSRL